MSRKPYTGIVKYYDREDDYTLRDKFFKVNGLVEGIYERYTNNGDLWMKTHYVADKPDGPCLTFNHRGEVVIYSTYYHGMRQGPCVEYYNPNRRESARYFYRDDDIHGQYMQFHNNGNIEVLCTYVNGVVEGDYETYFEDGLVHEYYEYRDGKKNGKYIKYHEDNPAKIEIEANYVNNMLQGPYKAYYLNGNVKEECTYDRDELHGEYKDYSRDGTLLMHTYYSHGVEIEGQED